MFDVIAMWQDAYCFWIERWFLSGYRADLAQARLCLSRAGGVA
jgi:hypothetical protein